VTLPSPVLRLEGIVKRFAGVTALDQVALAVERGEVHVLVGENGAGKSTLVKIVTGAYRRDAGAMWLDGAPVTFNTPAEAQAAGIVAVHQELHLLPRRTVAENVLLGREPRRWSLVHWRRMFDEAAALLADLGLAIDPRAELGTLGAAARQMVAITRAVSLRARVLLLDEPTASLPEREVARLFQVIGRLKSRGTAIVYISHRLDELYAIGDRVTVLRDGRRMATQPLAGLTRLDLVGLMLGKSSDARPTVGTRSLAHGAYPAPETGAPLLRAEGLARGTGLRGVSLEVCRGEVVGLAGLLGSGRTEVARLVFGADRPDRGSMEVRGAPHAPRSPSDAIAARIAFLPEDRKAEGIIPDLSVRENLTLAALPAMTRFGIVDSKRQRAVVEQYVRHFGIKAASAEQPIRELSGGNQQKVLLARWLCTRPELFLVDEPTRGIDVGARAEIQALLGKLALEGLGVLLISSDLEELVESSSRVVVLRDGSSVAELGKAALSPEAVVHAIAGG
jgi:monosaccharide-transporting ATPase